jgi:hypothetical protein
VDSLTDVLVAAAFCPHPPLLVPELAGAAAPELDALRSACGKAVTRLLAAGPDVLCVLGPGDTTEAYPAGSVGDLADFGYARPVVLGSGSSGVSGVGQLLPLSLTVGAYLLAGHEPGPVVGQAVAADLPAAGCAELGRSLAQRTDRLALLVMGDGAARRTPDSPGAFDPDAVPFDDAVGRALESADPAGLLGFDAAMAVRALAGGRVAWQVAAGAVSAPLAGELLYADDPYGVGYFVATWTQP